MRFIRSRDVERLSGLSGSTVRRLERLGQFPPRRRVSPGAVAWVEEEITEWLSARQRVDTRETTKEA